MTKDEVRNLPDEIRPIHDGDGFFYINIILMTVVVEGDKVAIILVNSGSGNDGTTKITANILCNDFRLFGLA